MPTPEFDALVAEVAEDVTVMGSAATLIDGLSQKLKDAVAAAVGFEELKAGIKKITTDLDASGNTLAAAVAANTPAEPPTP